MALLDTAPRLAHNEHDLYVATNPMDTDDALQDRIAKIDQEIEDLKAATDKKISALSERRKPLLEKRRTRDRATDAHCLALYASTALMFMKTGDKDAHAFTKRVLQHLRKTDRHRKKLRNWPRLEEAFTGYQSAGEAQQGGASGSLADPTGSQDLDADAELSHEQPTGSSPQRTPDTV